MCGICGIATSRGAVDRERLAAMSATLVPPRPGLGRHASRRRGRARRAAARDHRPDRRRPADRERGRHGRRRPERRDLQLPRADARARARGPPVPHALRHRGRSSTRYEEWGPGFAGAAARHVRVAIWDARERQPRARPRPVRDQAALLPRRRRRALVRLGARRAAARRDRPRRARGVPRLQLDPRAALDLQRDPQAAARAPAHLGGRARRRSSRFARPGPLAPRGTTRTRPSWSRSAARGCATRCARISSPTCRSACCSPAASTRARSRRSRRRSRRSPCGRSRSASRRRRSTSSPARARSPSATARSHRELVLRPDAALLLPALARRVRRAVRRLVGAPDLPRLEARRRGREGRALGRGRRRALRRLLHLRRRPARASGSGRSRRCARPLVERLPSSTAEGELRLQGQALRARRAPAAARAPPRLEGDLLRGRARRAHRPPERRSTRSHGYRARFAETEGHELLTRLQDVDFGLYLVDDLLRRPTARRWRGRSRRACRSWTRSSRTSRSRCRSGTRCAASRRSGCCGKAVEPLLPHEVVHGRKRGFSIPAAAWLRGELEPFARETLSAETLAPPGLLRPDGRDAACSTTTSRAARISRASSGACSRSRSGTSATSKGVRARRAARERRRG